MVTKRLIVFLLAALLFSIWISCGGYDGWFPSGFFPEDYPSISNLTYSPTSAYLNSGGGTATVNAGFDFFDEKGNLSTSTYVIVDSAENWLSGETTPLTGFEGVKAGRINVRIIIPTTTLGDFSFHVYVTDIFGLNSDCLTGSFSITEASGSRGDFFPFSKTSEAFSRSCFFHSVI